MCFTTCFATASGSPAPWTLIVIPIAADPVGTKPLCACTWANFASAIFLSASDAKCIPFTNCIEDSLTACPLVPSDWPITEFACPTAFHASISP